MEILTTWTSINFLVSSKNFELGRFRKNRELGRFRKNRELGRFRKIANSAAFEKLRTRPLSKKSRTRPLSKNCEKATVSFTSCLYNLMEHIGSHWTSFRENLLFECFSKVFLENSRLITIWQEITGTSREHLCTFVIISRPFLVKIKNVSDTSCIENQNTHFLFINIFRKYGLLNMVQPDIPGKTI